MDRSLVTLLRSLQSSSSYEDASRLLPSATSLLSQLSNPLNVTLLSSQILSNNILFPQPTTLQLCRRIFGLFYTASFAAEDPETAESDQARRLPLNAWTRAVILGADDKSPRWRHILLLGGILLGLGSQRRESLSSEMRTKLESALVTATNLTLDQKEDNDTGSRYSIVMVLNHTFGLLSDYCRSQLRYALFLPLAIDATFFSREGLEHGYWLGMIDGDIRQADADKFNWGSKTSSFQKLHDMRSKALISALGPLSRLIGHSIENVKERSTVVETLDQISDFARTLALSWRRNKFSEIEAAEESDFLDQETLKQTLPLLWQVLRETFFAVLVLLRATLGRLLCDPFLSADANSPFLAMQSLHILRHFNFITSRFGQASTAHYTFVNFTALDILNNYPAHSENFLHAIRPTEAGMIPPHPLDRSYDLFFLNTAEHFTLSVSAATNEELLLATAMTYVNPSNVVAGLSETYEAAHSVILAVFAAPQNSEPTSKHLPVYIESLLQAFPSTLSSRQFRLAVKSVMRLTAPPSAIARAHPLLQSIVLELVHDRASHASPQQLPAIRDDQLASNQLGVFSEQSVLVLALIDSLPFLPVLLLEDWLPLTALSINSITTLAMKTPCQQRFWEVLSSGEMDVERAAACVTWWTTRRGREMLLYGDQYAEDDDFMMTGALQHESKL